MKAPHKYAAKERRRPLFPQALSSHHLGQFQHPGADATRSPRWASTACCSRSTGRSRTVSEGAEWFDRRRDRRRRAPQDRPRQRGQAVQAEALTRRKANLVRRCRQRDTCHRALSPRGRGHDCTCKAHSRVRGQVPIPLTPGSGVELRSRPSPTRGEGASISADLRALQR